MRFIGRRRHICDRIRAFGAARCNMPRREASPTSPHDWRNSHSAMASAFARTRGGICDSGSPDLPWLMVGFATKIIGLKP